MHHLINKTGLIQSEHAWCAMDICLSDRELSNVKGTVCSRPGLAPTPCRCPPGAFHQADLRRGTRDGRKRLLRQAEAQFVERLWTLTTSESRGVPGRPVRHPRSRESLDRGGPAHRAQRTASTPDSETQSVTHCRPLDREVTSGRQQPLTAPDVPLEPLDRTA